MKTAFSTRSRILLLLLTLSLSLTVSAENLPDNIYGVELGKTTVSQAAQLLKAAGRPVKEKDHEESGCIYLFIYGKDKPIKLWGQSWTSVMYVAEKGSDHPINEVFISTGFMGKAEAEAVYKEVETVLKSYYGKSACKDKTKRCIFRQGAQSLRLAMRKSKDGNSWYVYVHTKVEQPARATSQTITNQPIKTQL